MKKVDVLVDCECRCRPSQMAGAWKCCDEAGALKSAWTKQRDSVHERRFILFLIHCHGVVELL